MEFRVDEKMKFLRADRAVLLAAFLLLVAPLGVALAVITPPGQVADEPAHMIRDQGLLHFALAGTRRMVAGADGTAVMQAGVMADPGPLEASFLPGTRIDAATIGQKSAIGWAEAMIFMPISPLAIYFPVFYAPGAAGLGLAHWVGASPYRAIYAGRLVSLAVYLALGFAALLLARRGAALMFLALALPMSLSLGASLNPDGLLVATSVLAAALLSRRRWRLAALCLGAVILVKPPYAPMALALLLPLPAVWRELARRLGLALVTVLPGAVWLLYVLAAVAAPNTRAAYHPGPLWPGDPQMMFHATAPVAQLQAVLAHPLQILGLIWGSIAGGKMLLLQMIGLLGWLNIFLPKWMYGLWLAGGLGALVADCSGPRGEKTALPGMSLVALIIFATITLVWLSQYLDWTDVGLAEIDGPTGRYLLPLVPLLGLGLPAFGRPGLRLAALSLPVIAAGVTLAVLPHYLMLKFYGF